MVSWLHPIHTRQIPHIPPTLRQGAVASAPRVITVACPPNEVRSTKKKYLRQGATWRNHAEKQVDDENSDGLMVV